jgi:hypothetical protein
MEILYLVIFLKKKWVHMYNTRGWMGGACVFQTVCAMLCRIQKCLFIMSLEALLCSFLDGVTSVFIGGLILHRWAFFFLFFSLPPLKNYSLVQLQSLLFLFLFFDLGLFVEILSVFDFIIQSQFIKNYIILCGTHSLDFNFFSWLFFKSFSDF